VHANSFCSIFQKQLFFCMAHVSNNSLIISTWMFPKHVTVLANCFYKTNDMDDGWFQVVLSFQLCLKWKYNQVGHFSLLSQFILSFEYWVSNPLKPNQFPWFPPRFYSLQI
jgi:hypothetical protein